MDDDTLQAKISEVEKKFTEVLVKLYRSIITKHRQELLANKTKFTREQVFAIEHSDFDPSLLLILDDITASLQDIKKCQEFSEIFYAGRHHYITTIIVTHDSKGIPAAARDNVFNFIFTSKTCLEYHFKTNKTNSFTKDIRVKADEASGYMQDATQGNTRIIFVREHNTFYKITAKKHKPFTLSSRSIVNFCTKIASKSSSIDKSNPFYKYAVAHI